MRKRVYEAAGVELAGGMDLSKIEGLARENAGKSGVDIPKMDLPEVPEANVELVKPHAAQDQGVDPDGGARTLALRLTAGASHRRFAQDDS